MENVNILKGFLITYHADATCWSQAGKLPVIITNGSWSCLFAFADILTFINS